MSEQEITVSIHEFDFILKNEINKRIRHLNLAAEQTRVLLLLSERMEMCQNEIAERLGKDKATIARMMGSLEKKGFISRYRDEKNWKRKLARLTALGKKSAVDILQISKELNKALSEGITTDELSEFYEVMNKMRENIEALQ